MEALKHFLRRIFDTQILGLGFFRGRVNIDRWISSLLALASGFILFPSSQTQACGILILMIAFAVFLYCNIDNPRWYKKLKERVIEIRNNVVKSVLRLLERFVYPLQSIFLAEKYNQAVKSLRVDTFTPPLCVRPAVQPTAPNS